LRNFGINNAIKTNIGDLVVWSSEKGRYYPFKAFDEEYFKELANSHFVLCPSGDCVWSYRFFEAVYAVQFQLWSNIAKLIMGLNILLLIQ
jgi:hypothetical protein